MKPYQQQTYYELLDVSEAASDEEIKAAYERAMALFGEESVGLYSLVDEAQADDFRQRLKGAAEVLLDWGQREVYDRSLGLGPRPPRGRMPAPGELVRQGVLPDGGDSTHPAISVAYAPPPSPAAAPEVTPEVRAAAAPPEPVRVEEPPVAAAAPDPEPRRAAPAPGKDLEAAPRLAEEAALANAEAQMAQVSARVAQRPRFLDIPPDAEFNGELLRRIRESAGRSLAQIADRTRISKAHLENVEADRYSSLPAPVYLRGILVSLARELGLDPMRVSKSYLALVQGSGQPPKLTGQ